MGGPDLQTVAAHPEGTAGKGLIVAAVLLGDQFGHDVTLVVHLAGLQVLRHGRIGFHRPDAVDAGHGCDDDHIIAFQQRPGGRVAHPVDLFVDLGFLLDVGIRPGDIGLRLVVVVIGHEVFNRVVREEAFEFAV